MCVCVCGTESHAAPLEYQVDFDKEGPSLKNLEPFLKVETIVVIYREVLMVLSKI